MVTLDDDRAVAIGVVPAAMPAAVVSVKVDARAAIIVAVVVAVATDAETESLGACHGRRSNRYGRQRSENARKLSHSLLLSLLRREGNVRAMPTFRE
jgi:hypothetical protein